MNIQKLVELLSTLLNKAPEYYVQGHLNKDLQLPNDNRYRMVLATDDVINIMQRITNNRVSRVRLAHFVMKPSNTNPEGIVIEVYSNDGICIYRTYLVHCPEELLLAIKVELMEKLQCLH